MYLAMYLASILDVLLLGKKASHQCGIIHMMLNNVSPSL